MNTSWEVSNRSTFVRIKSFLSLALVAVTGLLGACSGIGPKPVGVRVDTPPLVERQQAPVPTRAETDAKQMASDLALLLQQAEHELLVYEEIKTSTDTVARAVAVKSKPGDYSMCRLDPPELTRLKYYATHSYFMVTQYRGRCVHHVNRLIDEQKFKGKREEVLPPKKKK